MPNYFILSVSISTEATFTTFTTVLNNSKLTVRSEKGFLFKLIY